MKCLFLGAEGDKADAASRPDTLLLPEQAEDARQLQDDGRAGGIIVAPRRVGHGIVVGADHKPVVRPLRARQVRDGIGAGPTIGAAGYLDCQTVAGGGQRAQTGTILPRGDDGGQGVL